MIYWPSKRSRLVFHWWLKFTFSWMANKHWDFYINQRLNLLFPFFVPHYQLLLSICVHLMKLYYFKILCWWCFPSRGLWKFFVWCDNRTMSICFWCQRWSSYKLCKYFLVFCGVKSGLIKFGILFLNAKFAKNKNSKLPKLSGCLYVWVYDLATSYLRTAIPTRCS